MFHKVESVSPLPNLTLLVSFCSGELKRYDVKPLLRKWKPFELLGSHSGLFEQVKVDPGGYGISWNDDIDLSCNELFIGGISE